MPIARGGLIVLVLGDFNGVWIKSRLGFHVTMPEHWYVQRQPGTVDGPFSERQISEGLASGSIGDGQFVRQGNQGTWHEARHVRAVFQQLAETGWYVRTHDGTFGPFTEKKLLDLYQTGGMGPNSEIRQGTSNAWKTAERVLSLWQTQKTSNPATREPAPMAAENQKWSTEPVRHIVMAVQLEGVDLIPPLQSFERLLLHPPERPEGEVQVARTNGHVLGRLSQTNSCQILANTARGLTHVTLVHSFNAESLDVVLILCPPGSDPESCREYINCQFHGASPAPRSP